MKKKVLLIDDDDVFRYIVKRVIDLKTPHIELIPANSCRAAIELLNNLQRGKESFIPDIILLDLDMPVMNGFEFLDTYEVKLRLLNPKIKIYIVSTTLNTEEKKRALSYKTVADFLSKPIEPELLETIFNQ
ncbi:MAG: response regulator [Flammeovirgaceae bacterium]|nr:response regulator [Flammeovirgaceae bacterium]MDW8286636.1 response regulator [Flammeovirgaceae bacterium]